MDEYLFEEKFGALSTKIVAAELDNQKIMELREDFRSQIEIYLEELVPAMIDQIQKGGGELINELDRDKILKKFQKEFRRYNKQISKINLEWDVSKADVTVIILGTGFLYFVNSMPLYFGFLICTLICFISNLIFGDAHKKVQLDGSYESSIQLALKQHVRKNFSAEFKQDKELKKIAKSAIVDAISQVDLSQFYYL